MKNIIIVAAAIGLLAACAEAEPETPVAEEPMAEAAPMEPVVEPESLAGTYEVTMADGTVGRTVMNEDGTYVEMMDGEEVRRGTFSIIDGRTCFVAEGETAPECWTDGQPAADGSWQATNDAGKMVTVRPIENDAGNEMMPDA